MRRRTRPVWRACAEPPSRPSAPRSGGGAQRRALTAVSTRARCRLRRRQPTTTSCGRRRARNPRIPALANTVPALSVRRRSRCPPARAAARRAGAQATGHRESRHEPAGRNRGGWFRRRHRHDDLRTGVPATAAHARPAAEGADRDRQRPRALPRQALAGPAHPHQRERRADGVLSAAPEPGAHTGHRGGLGRGRRAMSDGRGQDDLALGPHRDRRPRRCRPTRCITAARLGAPACRERRPWPALGPAVTAAFVRRLPPVPAGLGAASSVCLAPT